MGKRLVFLLMAASTTAWAGAAPHEGNTAFDAYATRAEQQLHTGSFLYSDLHAEAKNAIRQGQTVVVEQHTEQKAADETQIHDWLGEAFLPGARLSDVKALMQDYANYKRVYAPDVQDSRQLERKGEWFRVYLKLLNKRGITLYYDAEFDVNYFAYGNEALQVDSRSTRMDQQGGDEGFLWRLNSYWRFRQTADGVEVQCRSISLSRGLPFGMGWIRPLIERFPRESLTDTMNALRRASVAKQRAN